MRTDRTEREKCTALPERMPGGTLGANPHEERKS
jgi:hypothetical protein